jgi:hypothetical protein
MLTVTFPISRLAEIFQSARMVSDYKPCQHESSCTHRPPLSAVDFDAFQMMPRDAILQAGDGSLVARN